MIECQLDSRDLRSVWSVIMLLFGQSWLNVSCLNNSVGIPSASVRSCCSCVAGYLPSRSKTCRRCGHAGCRRRTPELLDVSVLA